MRTDQYLCHVILTLKGPPIFPDGEIYLFRTDHTVNKDYVSLKSLYF